MSATSLPVAPSTTRWLRNQAQQLLLPLLGIITALLIGAVIILISGFNPLTAYGGLWKGAFGDFERLNNTLAATTPYIFTTLAVIFSFRAGLFNIGAEGQFKIGAIVAAWVGFNTGSLPFFIAIPLTLLAGVLGGALWGAIPGALKAFYGSHEVIVTIMLNYIATFITSYLVGADGPLRGNKMTTTQSVGPNARIPTFFGFDTTTSMGNSDTPLHIGFLLALMTTGFLYWLLWRTPLGFEIRTIGLNPSAGRYAGINVSRIMIVAMAGGGLLAGMAGALEVMGNPDQHYQYSSSLGSGYGFNSIAIALLAKNNPLAAVPAALLFAALQSGASTMQFVTTDANQHQLPGDIISIVQALVIIFIAADQILRWLYRLKFSLGEQVTLSNTWGEDIRKPSKATTAREGKEEVTSSRSLRKMISNSRWPLVGVTLLVLIFVWRTIMGTQSVTDLLSVITLTLTFATPITLGALSGTFSERSGVVNIGIEGMMLTGAFFGALLAITTGNVWIALVLAPFFAVALALVHAVLSIYFKVDQIISGTVINLLAFGLTSYLLSLLVSSAKPSETPTRLPSLLSFTITSTPFGIKPTSIFGFSLAGKDELANGQIIGAPFDIGLISVLAIAIVFIAHYILFYTSWGLRTRAVGENPKAADTAGVNVFKVRYFNVMTSGFLAGLGGAYFSLQVVGYFRENMTVGSGFIALAAMIFGKWTPLGAWGAALLFGFCQALDTSLQSWYGESSGGLHTFTQALPYVVTIIVLTGIIGRSRPPAAVGVPYSKQ